MKPQLNEIEDMEMPEISYGECKNRVHRPIVMAELANGFCIVCWDKGKGTVVSPNHMRKNKRGFHKRLGQAYL